MPGSNFSFMTEIIVYAVDACAALGNGIIKARQNKVLVSLQWNFDVQVPSH